MRPPRELRTDGELIRSASEDPAAFELLFTRHAAPMRAWFFAQTSDVGDANDLLAETFARAWRGRKRFRGDQEGSGGAWLYAIARHAVIHHRRRGCAEIAARRRLGVEIRSSCEDHEDDIIGRIDALSLTPTVAAAFRQLSLGQQHAIGWRVVDDLSYGELADKIGCSPQTARARVSRGLKALRSTMEAQS